MPHDLQIGGLDQLRALLFQHASELDYVALDEVIHRQRRAQLARVAFTPKDLGPWLARLDADEDALVDEDGEPIEDVTDLLSEDDDDDDGWSDLAVATEEEEDEEEEDRAARLQHQALCRAVLLWVQDEVSVILQHRPRCSFRLRLHGPKGEHLESQCFQADNLSYRPPRLEPPPAPPAPPTPVVSPPPPSPAPAPQLPVPAPAPLAPLVAPPPLEVVLPAPPPPAVAPAFALALCGDRGQLLYLDPETIPESRVWRALGQATEQLLARAGAAYGNIIELQSRTVLHQSAQLDKSQALVESLASQLLAARRVQDGHEADQQVDERQLRVREELGKTFLSELGSLGRVVASSRLGVSPELVELGDLITTSPELGEALRDPNVRALLKDEKTRKELAQLLLLASKKPTDPQVA